MRRWVLGLLWLSLACGSGETGDADESPLPPARTASESVQAAEPAAETAAEARGARPSLGKPLSCPEGARVFERRIEDTRLRWCERPGPDGRTVQEGPYEMWLAERIAEAGSFRGGQRHGHWVAYGRSGEPQSEGAYDQGRRVGPWIFRDADGAVVREVDYSGAAPADAEVPEPALGHSVRFQNSGESDFRVRLEPDAGDWTLEPGESISLVMPPEASRNLVIERDDTGVRVIPAPPAPGVEAP